MKRRTEIILIGVVAVAAAVFAMKRGGGSPGGRGRGGTCCSQMPDLNVWTAVFPAGTSGVTTNLTVTNRQR